jgi:hypothetical protein
MTRKDNDFDDDDDNDYDYNDYEEASNNADEDEM